MKLSVNERKFLEAIRDNDFKTISQVTQACGFQRAMGYHYFRTLLLAGLIDGFEVTYAGYKMLDGEELIDSDDEYHVGIKLADAEKDAQ